MSSIKRKIYFAIGAIFFCLGIIGYYLPVLPGTIFLILSAYFFMHSSKKLYKKIINHPNYGFPIKQYIEKNVISLKSKIVILVSMWVATTFSFYLIPNLNFEFDFRIPLIVSTVVGSFFVLKTKNK
tara:strand:+ start:52 stop:429 length:378 start_codon:yes stop_codon:yes gene_type:complete